MSKDMKHGQEGRFCDFGVQFHLLGQSQSFVDNLSEYGLQLREFVGTAQS